MTVSSQTNKVVIAGNGVTTVFSYNFQINNAADAQVIYTDSTGVSTTLSSTLYSISGLTSPTGGTVTYPLVGSPIATGTSLTITRQLTLTQPTSIANQGAFYPTAVESAIDRAVMEIQQVSEQIGRTLTAPITDATAMTSLPSATARANKALVFDASGNPTAGVLPASGVISSAMAPVVSAASLGAGRTAFGLGGLAVEGIGKGLQDDGAGNARVNFITEAKVANYLVTSADHLERYIVTGPITFTLPATSTLWNGFELMVDVYGGSLNLTPNAADSVETNATGVGTYIPNGGKAYIGTNGAGTWYVRRARTTQSAVVPGGYITPASGYTTPYYDVISATTIYYTPDSSGIVPVYDGAVWVEYPFSELSCALNATQQLASSAHDVFITIVNGAPTLVIGPAWRQPGFGGGTGGVTSATNATPIVVTATGHGLVNGDVVYTTGFQGNIAANGVFAVSGVAGAAFTLTGSVGNGVYTAGTGTFASRGNGTGTTQLTRVGGIYTNTVQITAYNGVTPYTINPGLATYVGSIVMDGVAGQISCYRSFGQNRKWAIWNAFNRKQINLKIGDGTASWAYSTAAWRASNNTANNSGFAFVGLPDEVMDIKFTQKLATAGLTGIGYASVAAPWGTEGVLSSTAGNVAASPTAAFQSFPTIGLVSITSLENGSVAGTYSGSEALMLMSIGYRG
jgi:hypothetical protein